MLPLAAQRKINYRYLHGRRDRSAEGAEKRDAEGVRNAEGLSHQPTDQRVRKAS